MMDTFFSVDTDDGLLGPASVDMSRASGMGVGVEDPNGSR